MLVRDDRLVKRNMTAGQLNCKWLLKQVLMNAYSICPDRIALVFGTTDPSAGSIVTSNPVGFRFGGIAMNNEACPRSSGAKVPAGSGDWELVGISQSW